MVNTFNHNTNTEQNIEIRGTYKLRVTVKDKTRANMLFSLRNLKTQLPSLVVFVRFWFYFRFR